MKLATIIVKTTDGDARHVAALTEHGAVDVSALGIAGDMNALIAGGDASLDSIRAALAGYTGDYLDEKTLVFGKITEPGKIVCEGLNFVDHAEETGGEAPKYPVFFSKFNDALAPANAPVALPAWQRCYDYEAELVIVVGKSAYNIEPEKAEEYIFGYAAGNDLSARDAQFLSSQWIAGKSFPGFAPVGPWIATRDELNPADGIGIRCRVNGAEVQNGNTRNMIFSCRETLAWASKFFALEPGDLIFTGTPAGVILGKPKGGRVWLKAGDVVTVEIDGIGALTTELV
ncbi:MAG: fumarylacetoacetate hydrolase family protein [Oscillospiraceae bacterium]|jgi:2-keto-4-pentenoate hydratase/2-oxohepta-3-ene-1,7-dioic acid hydratase in catechol pathway|nr:fumarylacetoacetate hydrolase family protein [Oscillospiraceae bacterium]